MEVPAGAKYPYFTGVISCNKDEAGRLLDVRAGSTGGRNANSQFATNLAAQTCRTCTYTRMHRPHTAGTTHHCGFRTVVCVAENWGALLKPILAADC